MLFAQDLRHIFIGVTRMNDQRQPGFPRGRDMDTQRGLLNFGAVGGIMVIKPGFTDPDKFGMPGQCHQFVNRGQRFVCRAHRVGAGGIEYRCMGFRNGTHGGFIAQARADRHHTGDARIGGIADNLVKLPLEIGEIQMAVAVCNLWCFSHIAGWRV